MEKGMMTALTRNRDVKGVWEKGMKGMKL